MTIHFRPRAWRLGLSALTFGTVLAMTAPFIFAQNPTTSSNATKPMTSATPIASAADNLTVSRRETLQEGLTLAHLSNGLTVIIQENHTAPNATVRCFVKNTGSINETGHLGAGLSHVLEHVVSGGTTTNRTEDETTKLVDLMGGVSNAFTSTNVTAYYIDCPAKDVMMAVDIIADEMQHIAFNPKEFERELRVIQQELKDGEANRSRVMWKLASEVRYLSHPARLPVIGYLDVLQKTAHEDIINFYKERYVPNNQIFTVVGDVNTEDVLKKVIQCYQGTPRGKMSEPVICDEPQQMTPRMAVREMDGPTFNVTVFWPTVKLDSEDLYALDLLDYILGEGDSSLLVNKYCMEQPLALSIGSFSATPHYAPGMFGIRMSLTEENYKTVVDKVVADVYSMRDILLPDELLAKAKKQKIAEQVFAQQSIQAQADSLAESYMSSGDPLFNKSYVEQIKKVTAQDIQRVAKKYFVPERFNKVVIAPLGKGQEATQSVATAQSSQLQEVKLANGVIILTKRIPNLPLVTMQVYVKGATLAETPQNAGVSKLAAHMCEKGNAKMTAQQIAEFFDNAGGAFSCNSARNTTSAELLVLKEDFAQASEILAESFLRPSFSQEEFDKLKIQTLGMLERKKADARSEATEAFTKALPKSSAFSKIVGGTVESVSKLTLDDVKKYHQTYIQPEGMVVAIFGDISNEDAIAQAKKLFGGLKQTAKPSLSFDHPNAISESTVTHVKTEKTAAFVYIAYECPSMFEEAESNAMLVLNAIMTGYGSPGGWLFPELRGAGLVYSAYGVRYAGPCPGYFTFIAQTRPEAVDDVVQRIRNNVEKAKRGEITQEEFDKAKTMILALHAQDGTTAGEQASQSALDTILGLGPEYDKGYDERVKAVTLEQVKAVAKKYLTKSIQVTVSNQEK